MTRLNSHTVRQEVWTLDGLKLAGQVFGPDSAVTVLALHGWLDNSASFEALAGELPDWKIVALDMPGHGLSDHRSADATYQIWDDIPQLVALLDQLNSEQFVLLGHSRGAMIATLLAAVCPDRVRALITLDAMLPLPADDAGIIDQFRAFLRDRARQKEKPVRVFASIEDYVERRTRAGEPKAIARKLATRALRQTGDGYLWRGDPRLSGASAIKLNKGQNEAVLKALTMPVLNIWASASPRMEKLTNSARALARDHVHDLTEKQVCGHHHWHMEAEAAKRIAEEITAFLDDRP